MSRRSAKGSLRAAAVLAAGILASVFPAATLAAEPTRAGYVYQQTEPAPLAEAGLVEAFASVSAGYGRGERDSPSLTQRSLSFLMVNATPREPPVPLALVRSA
ncbi:MAG TPA: hypothetical protein VES19_04775 [Candidatus Limnocylindrales bacterium]|nr:hypothetical protein [Candidatus Limnocylindrales bacterium]